MVEDVSYLETVGKTPLVRLKNSLPEEAKVCAIDLIHSSFLKHARNEATNATPSADQCCQAYQEGHP